MRTVWNLLQADNKPPVSTVSPQAVPAWRLEASQQTPSREWPLPAGHPPGSARNPGAANPPACMQQWLRDLGGTCCSCEGSGI